MGSDYWRATFAGVAVVTTLGISAASLLRQGIESDVRLEIARVFGDAVAADVSGRDAVITGPVDENGHQALADEAKLSRIVRQISFAPGALVNRSLAAPPPADLARMDWKSLPQIPLDRSSAIEFDATIQITFQPDWQAGTVGDDPCLIGFGDTQFTEYAICISDDRNYLTLKNEQEFEFVPHDFTEGKAYTLTVAVSETGSDISIDGVPAGTLPVTFGEPSTETLSIGSLDGSTGAFQGWLGRLRIWNRSEPGIFPETSENGADPVWQPGRPGFSAYFDNIVLHSVFKATDKLAFNVLPAVTDPVGDWIVAAESSIEFLHPATDHARAANAPAYLASGKHGNYSSYKVLAITRDSATGGLVVRTDADGSASIWQKGQDWTKPLHFARTGSSSYQSGSEGVLTKRATAASGSRIAHVGRDGLVLDGSFPLARFFFEEPAGERESGPDPWQSTFVNPEQIKNFFFSFSGFDIAHMDPVNLGDLTGVRAPVFLRPGPDSTDYKSTGEGRFSPGALFFKPLFTAESENTVEIVKTQASLHDKLSQSLGFNIGAEGVGAFKFNKSWQEKSEAVLDTEHQHGFGESHVLHYALVLDKTKMDLDPAFRDAVAALAQGGEPALDALIRRFGTHYPFAATYGGKVHVDFRKSLTGRRQSRDRESEIKAGVDAEIEGIKGGIDMSRGTGSGAGAANENGIEVTDVQVVGGRGMGSLESLEIQDTVLPVYMDLRPISDLLSPVYFNDPLVTDTLRPLLAAKIKQYAAAAPFSGLEAGRYAARITGVTCVSDGDNTLSADDKNLATSLEELFLEAAILGPLAAIGDLLFGDGDKITLELNDAKNTCELSGTVALALSRGDAFIGAKPGETFGTVQFAPLALHLAASPKLLSDPIFGPAFEPAKFGSQLLGTSAVWNAGESAGAALSIPEGQNFALKIIDVERGIVVPAGNASSLRLTLAAALEETDTIKVKTNDAVTNTLVYKLTVDGTKTVPLPSSGSQSHTLDLNISGRCTEDDYFSCSEAPYAGEVKAHVTVEFEIERID